jgi:hypothetical protein
MTHMAALLISTFPLIDALSLFLLPISSWATCVLDGLSPRLADGGHEINAYSSEFPRKFRPSGMTAGGVLHPRDAGLSK